MAAIVGAAGLHPTLAAVNTGKKVLLANRGLRALLDNFVFDVRFKVTKFTVSVFWKGVWHERATTGNRFSKQQISLIRRVIKHRKVYIENIEAIGPDGTTRKLAPIMFRIR